MSCGGSVYGARYSKICVSSYIKLLEDCIQSKSLRPGKLIHQHFLKNCHPTVNGDAIVVLEKLSRLYIACNKTLLAHHVFDEIPHQEKKNKVSIWNSIIRGYAWDGPFDRAISLYWEMLESGVRPNNYTYPFVLKACSVLQAIEEGKELHENARIAGFDSDIYVCTALVDFYAKCGSLKEAREVFDNMPTRDVVAWNAIISGFALHGLYDDVIRLISRMQEVGLSPNSSTVVSILPAVGESSALVHGQALHAYCMKQNFHNDIMVATGLIDMYGKCGCLYYSSRIFDRLSFKNEVTWSAMIGSCISCGSVAEALKLFKTLLLNDFISLSIVTLGAILRVSAMLTDLGRGRSMHGFLIKVGCVYYLMLANTLLSMYSKCGMLNEAEAWFSEMVNKDTVSYSAYISGCTQSGYAKEALVIFKKMQLAGIQPDSATMVGVLPACSQLAALQHGINCHGYSVLLGFTENISISNALIDMYSKCGKLQTARLVFNSMQKRDIVTWNTMIFGYGIHGHGNEAVKLFLNMQKSMLSPDDMTFISVLSACSHSGLVEEGRMQFHSMTQVYHINPRMEHYVCMVDLLGRVGELDEAKCFIQRMPMDPDVRIWSALLAGCRVYKNIELGEEVASKIQSMGPESTGNFVLLSNMYSDAGRWNDAANARIVQRSWGLKKIPGCSWVEINRAVHGFVGGDRSHSQSEEIYTKLQELLMEMKKMGYNNSLGSGFVMQDVEEEEKESILLYHSEKLAVAFALLSLPSNNKPILINKNLRVCGDCHNAFKYISIISNREITVRDANRFHHFRDGICNCRDFCDGQCKKHLLYGRRRIMTSSRYFSSSFHERKVPYIEIDIQVIIEKKGNQVLFPMSNGGLPRPRVWRPEQRNEAPRPMPRNEAPRPMPGLHRPFSWQTEQGYAPNINDWEWMTSPTTHQVGPSSSHGGGDYASYGGLVIIQERRGPGPFVLPSFTPMFNDHIATSYPRLIIQPTDHMATSYPRLIMPTNDSARRYPRQLSQEVSVPRQVDQTRMNREEQKEMLSKLKKEVYYPKESVRSLATRLSSFYRNDANATFNYKVEEDDGKRSCVVCLEDFKPYETVMTTPCSHMFHEDCILPWMKSNGKCPVCRMVIYVKRNNHFPTHDNNHENNPSVQIDPFELIALVRAMEESIGWG